MVIAEPLRVIFGEAEKVAELVRLSGAKVTKCRHNVTHAVELRAYGDSRGTPLLH